MIGNETEIRGNKSASLKMEQLTAIYQLTIKS